ncbi:hypothetical protein COCSADRAFT_34676 [Bipolaris sorokiniana ND90Pr]|uniref:C2H2-type domain-containing protein n=1 Tax=Cochliobolus sativus (strain ND90Pr / ATCC 201652) TaxID=665912 RepID=M2TA75_COCSN|nr:uncharacterized protein COCSADRAFT_34676 [Bipolaris sorokiniana ND90Pr]EMD66086.1 hypothetical protein COCSADRAFT_34676 [Bipolaris sorokiniana ND90Pr]
MNYLCVPCNRSFSSSKAFEQHKKNSPVHKKTFCCETCNCPFKSEKALIRHRLKCKVDQEASLNQHPDEVALSTALARCSIPDTSALTFQNRAQTLVSANPVAITTTLPKIAKSNKLRLKQETREYFMFPELHSKIAEAVLLEIITTWFNNNDDDNFIYRYHTHIMGKFTCHNNKCGKKCWTSRKVPIEISGYDRNGYSAIVYNQRCKSCNCLGTFAIDEESYIKRVSYRIKKWAGVEVVQPDYEGKPTKPHERAYCEGCKRGKCTEDEDFWSD